MKMEPIVSSETSAIRNQTPRNYPKRNNLHLEHGESLRTRILIISTRNYRGADKSLARPGRNKLRKNVRDARDFNNIETRAFINLFFLQDKAPTEIHAILTETLVCFLPGRAKDLSAPPVFIPLCAPIGL